MIRLLTSHSPMRPYMDQYKCRVSFYSVSLLYLNNTTVIAFTLPLFYFLSCLLYFSGFLRQSDSYLLNEHYHDDEQCDRGPQNILLVTVIAVLKCDRAQATASDNACHRRISENCCDVDSAALKKRWCRFWNDEVDYRVYGRCTHGCCCLDDARIYFI